MIDKIKTLFRSTFTVWFYRIYWSIQLSLARNAIDVLGLARELVRYELRRCDEKLSIPGDVHDDDLVVSIAAAELLEQELGDSLKEAADGLRSRIDDLAVLGRRSMDVSLAVAEYYLIWRIYYLVSKQEDKAAQAFEKARSFASAIDGLTPSDLGKVKRTIRKRLSALHSKISDRYGFKLDLNMSDIAGLLGVWSVFFLISGFIYVSTLLGALGVDASVFLGVGDYVSASIDQIKYAGFATAWGAFIYLAGAFHGSRKSVEQVRRERKSQESRYSLTFLLVLSMLGLGAYLYLENRLLFWSHAKVTGILLSMFLADWLGDRAFKNSLQAVAFLTAVFTFFVHMLTAVGDNVYRIQTGIWKPSMQSSIAYEGESVAKLARAEILLGAGSVLFLLDRERHKVIVIPRDRVTRVEVEWKSK